MVLAGCLPSLPFGWWLSSGFASVSCRLPFCRGRRSVVAGGVQLVQVGQRVLVAVVVQRVQVERQVLVDVGVGELVAPVRLVAVVCASPRRSSFLEVVGVAVVARPVLRLVPVELVV